MPWNPNITWTEDGLKNEFPLNVTKDLVAALTERFWAVGVQPLGTTFDDLNQVDILQTYNLFRDYQEVFDETLTSYVNHLDNGGDWTGQNDVPWWTLEAMEAKVGFERPSLSELGGTPNFDWYIWYHDAINLLLWSARKYYGFGVQRLRLRDDATPLALYEKLSVASSYEDAAANWPGSWTQFSIGSSNIMNALLDGGQYRLRRTAGKYDVPLSGTAFQQPTFDMEVYLYTTSNPFRTTVYEPEGLGFIKDKLALAYVQSGITPAPSQFIYTFDLRGIIDTVPPNPAGYSPTEAEWINWQGLAGQQHNVITVLQYDVPGGFEYVA